MNKNRALVALVEISYEKILELVVEQSKENGDAVVIFPGSSEGAEKLKDYLKSKLPNEYKVDIKEDNSSSKRNLNYFIEVFS